MRDGGTERRSALRSATRSEPRAGQPPGPSSGRGAGRRSGRRAQYRLRRTLAIAGLLVLLLGLAAGVFVAWRWPGELAWFWQTIGDKLARFLPGRGPVPPAVLVVGLRDEPRGLNPLLYTDPASRHVTALLFTGLTRVDARGAAEPGVAVSWESGAGNRVWTFKIRSGATWHDGQPLTARDVVFTINALASVDFPGPAGGEWRGHRAAMSGEDTVVISLPAPDPDFPVRAAVAILPRHILSGVAYHAWYSAGFNRQPVGSGPFRFGGWRAGDELSLVANPGYFLGAPGLPGITFRFAGGGVGVAGDGAGGQAQQRSALPYGQGHGVETIGLRAADFAGAVGGVWSGGVWSGGSIRLHGGLVLPAAVHELARQRRDLVVRRFPDLTFAALLPNHRRASLEPAVRAAIKLAIDPAALMAAMARENGIEGQLWQAPDRQAGPYTYAGGPFVPGTAAGEGQPAAFRRDLAAARQALAGAGWADTDGDGIVEKGGRPLELVLALPAGRSDLGAVAAELAKQVREAGIAVRPQPLGVAEYLGRWAPPFDFDLLLVEWATVGLGDVYELFHSSQVPVRGAAGELRGGANIAGAADTTLDSLLTELRAISVSGPVPAGAGTDTSPAASAAAGRAVLYRAINDRLNSISAWIWLWRETSHYAHPRTLEGPDPGPWSLYWNVHEWRWR